MLKIKEKIKSVKITRKKVIVLCAVVILVATGTIITLKMRANAAPTTALPKATRTVTLNKSTLTESVTVTGTVKSESVTNVTSTLNYPVSEILVKEGETVTELQMLARLSTEELDKQITKQREAIADAVAKAQTAYDEAVLQRDTAYTSAINAENELYAAQSTQQSAENTYNAAKASVSSFQAAYDTAAANEKAAVEILNKATADALALPGDITLEAALLAAQTAFDTAVNDAKAAQDALNMAKPASGYDAARQSYEAAVQATDSARKALDSFEGLYSNAEKGVNNAMLALDNAAKSDALTELLEKREECVVLVPSAGTVTNVNAVVGSAPQQNTALFIIQDTDNLKVSVSIDEYDIKSITQGMPARIKSDATGDAEISGSVSQISLTAQSTGSTSATSFGAEVTVDSEGSGLLIGMNAQVEIIISEKADVFAVPYDAIGENESGEYVVYKRENGEFVPVVVEKGMETDYYIEITCASLAQGDVIRASADESLQAEQESSDDVQMPGNMNFGGEFNMSSAQGGAQMTPPQGFSQQGGNRNG